MRRRLLTAMLLVAALAVLGFGLPLAWSVQALYRDEAQLQLSEEAARAAVAVPGSFARTDDLPELPEPAPNVQIALYDAEGRRILGQGPTQADAAVRAALVSDQTQRRRGQLVVAIPISDEEVVVGAVRASLAASSVRSRTLRTWAGMTTLAAGVLVGAGLLAARRSRSLALPLAQVGRDAELLGAGGELAPRPDTGLREIDAVQSALTHAAARLNDALARERQFSADLAHQLRTPLASLRLRLETEQLERGGDAPGLDGALRDVDRLQQTIDDLLSLARDTGRRQEEIDLHAFLDETAARWRSGLRVSGRELLLTVEPGPASLSANPSAIRQVLDVLLDNAIQHGAGDISLVASGVGTGSVLAVSDEGTVRLDAEQVFRRRGAGAHGTGIGLALARRLAEADGMRLLLADPGPHPAFHLVIGGPADPVGTSGTQ